MLDKRPWNFPGKENVAERFMEDNITEVAKDSVQTQAREAVSKAFTKAFQDEPAYKMDPTQKPSEVLANASLPDEERLKSARKLLEPTLTPKQKGEYPKLEAGILEAHYEPVIAHKARILKESGINKEQRRSLMEAYITGLVSPARSAVIDTTASTDQAVRRIAEEMVESITAGVADEVALNREVERIGRQIDAGVITDQAGARNLKITFEALRQEAISPRRPERRSGTPSRHENIINAIRQLEQQPPSLSRDAALEDARRERDYLLEQGNRPELGLYNLVKGELIGFHYDARVKVTNKEKEGKEEYEGRGKLQRLAAIKEAAHDPNWIFRDPRLLQDTRLFQGETAEFWSSSRIRQIEQNLGLNQGDLERTYGGSIDYVYQQGIDMVVDVVNDRKVYRPRTENPSDQYPNNGLYEIWNGVNGIAVDPQGRPLYDEEGEIVRVSNFDEVREAIETERRRDP